MFNPYGVPVIPSKKKSRSRKKKQRRVNTRSAEAQVIGRQIALLALAWTKQGHDLRVRQRETLRRAFTAAGELLGWAALEKDPVDTAVKEVLTLARAGARSLTEDVEDELKAKKAEVPQLRKAAESLQGIAEEESFDDTVEFSYTHTARQGDSLVTKTETLELEEADAATSAAETIEKKIDSWDKLRGQMFDELKQRKRRVEEMTEGLPEFATYHKRLVREVLVLLH